MIDRFGHIKPIERLRETIQRRLSVVSPLFLYALSSKFSVTDNILRNINRICCLIKKGKLSKRVKEICRTWKLYIYIFLCLISSSSNALKVNFLTINGKWWWLPVRVLLALCWRVTSFLPWLWNTERNVGEIACCNPYLQSTQMVRVSVQRMKGLSFITCFDLKKMGLRFWGEEQLGCQNIL